MDLLFECLSAFQTLKIRSVFLYVVEKMRQLWAICSYMLRMTSCIEYDLHLWGIFPNKSDFGFDSGFDSDFDFEFDFDCGFDLTLTLTLTLWDKSFFVVTIVTASSRVSTEDGVGGQWMLNQMCQHATHHQDVREREITHCSASWNLGPLY